jgi:hypothetical protein
VQEQPNRMVPAFGAERADGRLSAPKVWRNQKCHVSGAPRLGDGGGLGEMSRKTRRNQGKIVGCFGAEGAVRRDTWLLQACKAAPYEADTKGAACKGVSAVRRHAGSLYDAGSYCYTLVKCLKPFVRNGKGVIEVDDHAQGPPINSEPLVMKQTHTVMRREHRRLLQVFWLSVC